MFSESSPILGRPVFQNNYAGITRDKNGCSRFPGKTEYTHREDLKRRREKGEAASASGPLNSTRGFVE